MIDDVLAGDQGAVVERQQNNQREPDETDETAKTAMPIAIAMPMAIAVLMICTSLWVAIPDDGGGFTTHFRIALDCDGDSDELLMTVLYIYIYIYIRSQKGQRAIDCLAEKSNRCKDVKETGGKLKKVINSAIHFTSLQRNKQTITSGNEMKQFHRKNFTASAKCLFPSTLRLWLNTCT